MLTTCTECGLQVSDKALSCPHCGFPMSDKVLRKYRPKSKRKRLPNGFGQITEIKGQNLRNPWRAMVTTGKTDEGKPICKMLKPQSYFATYNEAYAALIEYHKNPFDLNLDMTMAELYDIWSTKHYEHLSSSGMKQYRAAWAYCHPIYDLKVNEFRMRHAKVCVEKGYKVINEETIYPSSNVKLRIKSVLNQMLDYAVEYEVIDRNPVKSYRFDKGTIREALTTKQPHIPFSQPEMELLWLNKNCSKIANIVLFQCFTGWRPGELGLLELKNIDLVNWTITGGIKTPAGKDRVVPIHPKIRDIVKNFYDEAIRLKSDRLINYPENEDFYDMELTYARYNIEFVKYIESLKLNPIHRPHDPRKHFITACKNANVDEYAIKYIVGHEIDDLTERVYTERSIEWLMSEILKIK